MFFHVDFDKSNEELDQHLNPAHLILSHECLAPAALHMAVPTMDIICPETYLCRIAQEIIHVIQLTCVKE